MGGVAEIRLHAAKPYGPDVWAERKVSHDQDLYEYTKWREGYEPVVESITREDGVTINLVEMAKIK